MDAATVPTASPDSSAAVGALATGDADATSRNTAEHAGMEVHDPPTSIVSPFATGLPFSPTTGGDAGFGSYGSSNGGIR